MRLALANVTCMCCVVILIVVSKLAFITNCHCVIPMMSTYQACELGIKGEVMRVR